MKRERIKKLAVITAAGAAVFLSIAFFIYDSVKSTIVGNEQESLRSLAKVNAQSLQSSLEAKETLVYAVFSGDMEKTEDIEKGLLRMREKGRFYRN